MKILPATPQCITPWIICNQRIEKVKMSSHDQRWPKQNVYELLLSLSAIIGVNKKERYTPQIIRLILRLTMTYSSTETTNIKDIENRVRKLVLKEQPFLI